MDEVWVIELEEDGAAGGYEIRDENGTYLADETDLVDALAIASEIARAHGIDCVRFQNAIEETN